MYVQSFFEKGVIKVASLGALAAAATSPDTLFNISGVFRTIVMLEGDGPNPVGGIDMIFKTKAGAAAAVPMPVGTLVYTAGGVPVAQFSNHQQEYLAAGGVLSLPAASVVSPFTKAILFDVPVLGDTVNQLAVAVKNNGTAAPALTLIFMGEQPRY